MPNIEKLNNVLFDIIENNKERYSELFKDSEGKKGLLTSIIKKIANQFSQKYSAEQNDVENIIRYIVYKDLCKKDVGFKIRDEDLIAQHYIARMYIILEDRIKNYWKWLDDRINSKFRKEEINLGQFEIPFEQIDDSYVDEGFEDDLMFDELYEDFLESLSKREREVFYFRFEQDQTQQSIANKLGVTQQAVEIYQKRIIKKYKNICL